jgi:hypothetical protein
MVWTVLLVEYTITKESIYGWLKQDIERLRLERRIDEIVRKVMEALDKVGLGGKWTSIVCAIGGYIHGCGKPVETRKVYEAWENEYSKSSIRVAIWAGRKAGIFQGGYENGLIYFTPEFARFLGLPDREVPPVKPRGAPRRKRKQRTQASAKQ